MNFISVCGYTYHGLWDEFHSLHGGVNLENPTAYEAEKDLQLGTDHGPAYTDSYLEEGFFGLYAPGEAHLVNTTPRDGQKVGRCILKVKVK